MVKAKNNKERAPSQKKGGGRENREGQGGGGGRKEGGQAGRQTWCLMPVIPTLGVEAKRITKSKASLGYKDLGLLQRTGGVACFIGRVTG